MFRRLTLLAVVLALADLGNPGVGLRPAFCAEQFIQIPAGDKPPVKLTADNWHVIECKNDSIVLVSRVGAGRVKITPETGPMKMRGRFADGTGDIETKQLEGPFLFIVTAEASGPCELIIIEKGFKDESTQMARRLVEVALNPIPPPGPVPPGPAPTPGVNPLPSDKLRVLMTYDTADTLTAKQNGILRSTLVHAAIELGGGEWRTWSASADAGNEKQWWKDAHARGKTKKQPHVIISSPKGFYEGFPDSVDAFIVEVKRLGG